MKKKKEKNEKKASSKNRCCKRWFREIVAKKHPCFSWRVSKKFTSQTLKTDYEYSFYLKTFHERFAMKAFIPKMLLVSSFG